MRQTVQQPGPDPARSKNSCSGLVRSVRWLLALLALALGLGSPGLCVYHCAVIDYHHSHMAGVGAHGHINDGGEAPPSEPLLVAPPPAIYPAVLAVVMVLAALAGARYAIRQLAAVFASWIRPPTAPPPRLFTA
jgi:hypothetical protein